MFFFRDLQENIDELNNNKIVEFIEEDKDEDNCNINNDVPDLNLELNEKIKPLISQFEEKTNEVRNNIRQMS